MNTQDPHPLARRDGPPESYDGALDAEARLGPMRKYALECVARHPGMTSLEIAREEHIEDPRVVNRRLNELEKLGLVRRGAGRACQVSGRRAAPWYVVDGAAKAAPVPAELIWDRVQAGC